MNRRMEYTAEKPWCQPEFTNDNAVQPEAEYTSFRAVIAAMVGLAIVVYLAGPWS